MPLPLVVPTVNPCSGCGKCCKDFGSDGVSTGLALFPDEFRLYSALAKKKGYLFESVPKVVAVICETGEAVVSHYVVLTQPCVFYADDVGCSIYSKRPLVCRAFPFSISREGDLMVAGSSARDGFLELASQVGDAAPGIVASRTQHEIRKLHERGIRSLLKEGVVTLSTSYYKGYVDVDTLLEHRGL